VIVFTSERPLKQYLFTVLVMLKNHQEGKKLARHMHF
jgi:hypothetical protein